MEKIQLPDYYECVKFTTVYGQELIGFLEPSNSSEKPPIFVESKKSQTNSNKKAQFFKPNEVISWQYN